MSTRRVEHRFYLIVCLTPLYAPMDWLAHRRPLGQQAWVHRVAWRASWAIQRRQNNLWNRYAERCRRRDR